MCLSFNYHLREKLLCKQLGRLDNNLQVITIPCSCHLQELTITNINGNKYTPNTILNGWYQKILILKS